MSSKLQGVIKGITMLRKQGTIKGVIMSSKEQQEEQQCQTRSAKQGMLNKEHRVTIIN